MGSCWILLSVLCSKFHTFLFLSLIAEPYTHHIFLKIQFLSDGGNFLTRWSWLDGKICFKRPFFRCSNGSPFSWKKTRYRLLIINFLFQLNAFLFNNLIINLIFHIKFLKKNSFSWNFSYLFFSPAGRTLGASGSRRLFFAWASASSSHACSIGFNAIILLWDNVKLSNLQIVLCDSAPTPGNFKFASALPTSACVTPEKMVEKMMEIWWIINNYL